MLYNIMKKASIPVGVSDVVRKLAPISDDYAENLHDELSSQFRRAVVDLYDNTESEHLAVDLYRLKNGLIDSLSEDLWGRWKKVRLNEKRVQQTIRGRKTVSHEEVIRDKDTGRRLDKHKRRMKGPIDEIEYSGGMFSQEELEKYFGANYSVLKDTFGEGFTLGQFVDGVLPTLAMSPAMVRSDSENNSLGVRVPKVLLDSIERALEMELYDVQNSDFQSTPSQRQVNNEIGRYLRAIRDAVNISTDLEEALEEESRLINFQKSKQCLANPKKPQNSLIISDEGRIGKYYFDDVVFDQMVESIEIKEIKDMIYPWVAEELDFEEDELDQELLKNKVINESLMLEVKTLARKKFNEEKEEVSTDFRKRLLEQQKRVKDAFNSTTPIAQILSLLSSKQVTWKDVRRVTFSMLDYRGGGNRTVLASVFTEVLNEIDTQSYVEKQIKEETEKKKVKKNKKERVVTQVVGVKLKTTGRKKLEKEVNKVFKGNSEAFTTTLIDMAVSFMVKKIKKDYVDANELDPNFV